MNENENLVPKRRFKEFTNTGTWEQRKLGEHSQILAGGTPKTQIKEYWEPKEIPWMSSGEINKKRLFATDNQISKLGFESSSARWVKENSVLIALAGQGKTRGTVAINEIPLTTNQSIAAIEPDDKLDSEFLFQNLEKRYEELRLASSGDGSRGGLNKQIISDIKIIAPSVKEQSKVGLFFKHLDDTIALHQRKLEKSKALKSAYLSEMFPAEGERKPKRRFAGFTDDWEQCKVRELFTVTRGQVLAATKTKDKETDEFIYPVYSSQTKNNGLMGFYNQYLFENAITWTTDGANAGTVNFRKGKFYSTNVNGVLLSDKGYANKAISEIINKIAWKHVSKVGNPKLMNNIMSEITIMIPSIEELNKISILFNQIDNTIALHQHKLEKLKNIKQAYLNELFV